MLGGLRGVVAAKPVRPEHAVLAEDGGEASGTEWSRERGPLSVVNAAAVLPVHRVETSPKAGRAEQPFGQRRGAPVIGHDVSPSTMRRTAARSMHDAWPMTPGVASISATMRARSAATASASMVWSLWARMD